MGKNKKKKKPEGEAPPIQMQEKRLSPEEILQKANQLKDRFSATMGKCDQMRSDGISETMGGMVQMIQRLLQDRAMDDARIKSLEQQLQESKKGKGKEIQKTETEASNKEE